MFIFRFYFHLLRTFVFQARLKRAELQKDRARAAFVAAKLRQQGKIKSKRYVILLFLLILMMRPCVMVIEYVRKIGCSRLVPLRASVEPEKRTSSADESKI